MKCLIYTLLLTIISYPVLSQSWTQVNQRSIDQKGRIDIAPDRFIVAELDDSEMRSLLWTAPDELSFDSKNSDKTYIDVMLSDGTIDQFYIVEYAMMEPALAVRYPDIKTFHGISNSDIYRKIRIDYTIQGFRAVVTDLSGQTYIDHYQRNDKAHRIIYRRNDFTDSGEWSCQFHTEKGNIKEEQEINNRFSGDCLFRSYRLSITATGEYSNFHGADDISESANVLSAVTTTVNRVNDVMEQDLTIRFLLIGNTDDIFYYDPASDPFTGNSSSAMINENQTNTTSVIGAANYDLGHIFSTGGSGLAGLGVLCNNSSKARGVTGISNPVGDPFDIDYVSHEIGHQLGGNHTMNNSCNNNRNDNTAMEPGSASTIMGYAGICAPNVQNNSDAYFHAISIQEMHTEITSNNCHQTINLANQAPVVDAMINKSIPHSTPFVLEAVATDGDGDPLTYNWEQMDHEIGTMPPQGTNIEGPMFRSLIALSDSMRYFPRLDNVINATSNQWEVLPTVGRSMDFRVTVRDNTFLPGCTDEQDVTITTIANAGPFVVTSIGQTPWTESSNVVIQWDVAGTDEAPISCSNVDILLSYDGGYTYPETLVHNTENDGSATVAVPEGLTSTARVIVKCWDNVFYNMNDADISIVAGNPSFVMKPNPTFGAACSSGSISFLLETESIQGYSTPINLSLSNLPSGVTSTIANNPILPGTSTMITVDDLDGLLGNYTMTVNGSSGSISRESPFVLIVKESAETPQLSTPVDGSQGLLPEVLLDWDESLNSESYEYRLGTSPGGDDFATGILTSTSIMINELDIATTYYWSVRGVNSCSFSDWSNEWTFETGACVIYEASDLPITISSSGTPTITSELSIKDKGTVSDLNILGLIGTHSWMEDLNFTLIAPDDSERAFWTDPCESENNFNINFDDEASSSVHPCPPIDGGTYIPESSLSFFDGKSVQGDWVMEVHDDFNEDGGEFLGWGIELCMDNYCDLTVDLFTFEDEFGSLQKALDCAVDGDTIFLESAIAGNEINIMDNTITITEDIVIHADINDNITILGEADGPVFIIDSGATVSLIGFNIENTDSEIGVLVNNGTLTIEDINLSFGADLLSVINNTTGQLTVKGECNIIEE